MKKSIIYLGIALVTFTNFALAEDFQQSYLKEEQAAQQSRETEQLASSDVAAGNDSIEKNSVEEDVDPGIGYASYEKSAEQIIAENNLITENAVSETIAICPEKSTEEIIAEIIASTLTTATDSTPVCNQKTTEQIIIEDSQIIESAVLNEVQPYNSGKSKKV